MMRTKLMFAAAALAAALIAGGCGGDKVSIKEGKARLDKLAELGVPDDEMVALKRHIFEMETAKRNGNGGLHRRHQDSLTQALPEFEARMAERLETAGPFMDSLRKVCDEKMASLSGMHLEEAQTRLRPIDSLMAVEARKLQARSALEEFSLVVDTLITLQKLADSLRGEFVGIWKMEADAADQGVRGSKSTEIHMLPDGKLQVLELNNLRFPNGTFNDVRIESFGTWDMMGDVAYHNITRMKRVRDNTGVLENNRIKTVRAPAFDDTTVKITEGVTLRSFKNDGFHKFEVDRRGRPVAKKR